MSWMLYGANGYSGGLIARAAVARGLRPVLAGRSRAPLEALAHELGLESRVAQLNSPAALAAALSGVSVVLNCAGPFSGTAARMLAACLAVRVHYLDITGEIAVFELAASRDGEARAAGIVVCCGVGFDVVPTDCVALALKEALPGATHLALGFDNVSPVSRGTARTMIEGLGAGGMVRRDGMLLPVPLGYKDRRIDFGAGEKLAMTIPWGDVSTAHRTTGIPNIEVYVPISPRGLKRIRRLNHLRWALRFGVVQRVLKSRIDRGAPGPDAARRDRTPSFVWGEARAADGSVRSARIVTANGYTVTAHASIGVVARLLEGAAGAGATTPARLMGSRYVETLPGSGRLTIS
jgi:short subunit dehydrogenase-like uncharacterized protein